MRPLAARTLWECVPAGTLERRGWRGALGSLTSTSVVPSGRLHVRDAGDAPVHDHLAAAGAIELADLSQPCALSPLLAMFVSSKGPLLPGCGAY